MWSCPKDPDLKLLYFQLEARTAVVCSDPGLNSVLFPCDFHLNVQFRPCFRSFDKELNSNSVWKDKGKKVKMATNSG